MKDEFHRILPRFLLLPLVLALLAGSAREIQETVDPLDRERSAVTGRRDPLEVQALVMGLADNYAAGLGEAMYLALRQDKVDSKGRWLAQSFLRNGVGAAIDIGPGINPNVSLLDLMVLSSLQSWAFETHWLGVGIGDEAGRDALVRIRRAEEELWSEAARVLDESHRRTLRELIEHWIAENPDRTLVSLVRFSDFMDLRRSPTIDAREAASGMLADIQAATDVVEQTELLGERLLWFLGRHPHVIGDQAELTTHRMADQPEIRLLFESLDALKGSVAAIGNRFDSFDDDLTAQQEQLFARLDRERALALEDLAVRVRAERSAAIDHAFDRLAAERHDLLDEIQQRQAELHPVMLDLQKTIDSSRGLAQELTGTIEALDVVVRRFDRDPDDDREPLEIADLTAAAAETGRAAEKLTALLEKAEELLGSRDLETDITRLEGLGATAVDRLFWRGLILVAVLLGGLALLRLVPRRGAA